MELDCDMLEGHSPLLISMLVGRATQKRLRLQGHVCLEGNPKEPDHVLGFPNLADTQIAPGKPAPCEHPWLCLAFALSHFSPQAIASPSIFHLRTPGPNLQMT